MVALSFVDDDMEGVERQQEISKGKIAKDKKLKMIIMLSILAIVVVIIIIIYMIFVPMFTSDGSIKVYSSSMQHSEGGGQSGIIDEGDIVFYNNIDDNDDVTTYLEGMRLDFKKYGAYGDVIIFYKNGYQDIQPVIHRAIIWLEFNTTSGNSFDVPELRNHNEGWHVGGGPHRWYNLSNILVLENIGYDHRDVQIDLGNIINYNFEAFGLTPHSGFITMGDNNRGNIDQGVLTDEHDINGNYIGPYGGLRVRPVTTEWIEGKVTHLDDR